MVRKLFPTGGESLLGLDGLTTPPNDVLTHGVFEDLEEKEGPWGSRNIEVFMVGWQLRWERLLWVRFLFEVSFYVRNSPGSHILRRCVIRIGPCRTGVGGSKWRGREPPLWCSLCQEEGCNQANRQEHLNLVQCRADTKGN